MLQICTRHRQLQAENFLLRQHDQPIRRERQIGNSSAGGHPAQSAPIRRVNTDPVADTGPHIALGVELDPVGHADINTGEDRLICHGGTPVCRHTHVKAVNDPRHGRIDLAGPGDELARFRDVECAGVQGKYQTYWNITSENQIRWIQKFFFFITTMGLEHINSIYVLYYTYIFQHLGG